MAPRERVGRILESKASSSAGILRRLLDLLMRRAERVQWSDPSAVLVFNDEAAELIRTAQRRVGRVSAEAARHVMAEIDSDPIPDGDESVSLAVQTRTSDIDEVTISLPNAIAEAEAAEDDEESLSLLDGAMDRLSRDLERVSDDALTEADRDVQAKVYERAEKSRPQRMVYRRVVHPEKSRGGSCGLCVVAATRVYTRPDLKPIHSRCHCDVVPITAHSDIGEAMNRFDLGELYDTAAGTGGAPLKRVRVTEDGDVTSTVKTPSSKGSRAKKPTSKAPAQRQGDWKPTPRWARQQLGILEGLPDTPYKRRQGARLRKILADAA